jgi:hypothetical protein
VKIASCGWSFVSDFDIHKRCPCALHIAVAIDEKGQGDLPAFEIISSIRRGASKGAPSYPTVREPASMPSGLSCMIGALV